MGRRDGLLSDKPKGLQEKPAKQQQALDVKTKSDVRPTGIVLDQMRELATPRSFDLKTKDDIRGKKPGG